MSSLEATVGYGVSLVIVSSCLNDIKFEFFGRKELPTLLALTVVSETLYNLFALISIDKQCLGDETIPQCAVTATALIFIMDWITSTTLDLAYIFRMRALLLNQQHRSWIRVCMIFSFAYGIADICLLLANYGALDWDTANTVWAVFNLLITFNQVMMHCGLIYMLTRGDLAKRASKFESTRTWLARALLTVTILYLAATIWYFLQPEWALPICNIPWALNIKIFAIVNHFIEKIVMVRNGIPATASIGAVSPSEDS